MGKTPVEIFFLSKIFLTFIASFEFFKKIIDDHFDLRLTNNHLIF